MPRPRDLISSSPGSSSHVSFQTLQRKIWAPNFSVVERNSPATRADEVVQAQRSGLSLARAPNLGDMAGPVHGVPKTTATSRWDRVVQTMKAMGNGGGSSPGKQQKQQQQQGRPGSGTTDWVRRSLLFLPLTLASYSLLRQYRLVGMVVDDRMGSSATSRIASVPQPLVRFVAPPASDDKHHPYNAALTSSSSASRLRPEIGTCARVHRHFVGCFIVKRQQRI
jgi:hypothetical protein